MHVGTLFRQATTRVDGGRGSAVDDGRRSTRVVDDGRRSTRVVDCRDNIPKPKYTSERRSDYPTPTHRPPS
jgi:hypothetical protein